jgi:hypothetical protein
MRTDVGRRPACSSSLQLPSFLLIRKGKAKEVKIGAARQEAARQGTARQGAASKGRQGKERQSKASQGKARQVKTNLHELC